jgi:hypothetical protein
VAELKPTRSLAFQPSVVEQLTRMLVQQIARENAANRAVLLYRMANAHAMADPETRARALSLSRRARHARMYRDSTYKELRLALGLSEEPSQVEIGDWGEAP